MKEMSFTVAALNKLTPPAKGRAYYRDNKEAGLALYLTANGVITFFVRKRVQGKDERIVLGRFPEISIENARKLCLKARAEVATGKDPAAERRRLRAEITFGEMFTEFLERHAKRFKKTWKRNEQDVTRLFSGFFGRKASQISRREWQAAHERVGIENGQYQANKVLRCVCTAYNKAIEWGWEGTNPTQGIRKFKEKSRDRFLRREEFPRFFESLMQDENPAVRDYILLSLLTGARRANVLAMRWEDISLADGEWRIPETKNGEAHTVPILGMAADIVQQRRLTSTSPFVFPGTGATGHLVEPKKAWKRILTRAGITDLRLHDLRRTLGSWMAANGATTAIIGKTLAHKSVQATKIYERLDLDPVRLSMASAHNAIFAAAGITEGPVP